MTRVAAVELVRHNFPTAMPCGHDRIAYVRLRRPATAPAGRVSLRSGWRRLGGVNLPAGDDVTVSFRWRSPDRTGRVPLRLRVVEQATESRRRRATTVLETALEVLAADDDPMTSRLRAAARRGNSWAHTPTDGIAWSSHGPPYPEFTVRARGCRVEDSRGRSYIDFVMGFGTNVLGHGDPRVRAAVERSVASTALTSLPSAAELELTERLTDLLPGAEAVLFGKNGSDVCTAAVRLARVVTGRQVILHCGYHGWHDWNRESAGFARTGIPPHGKPLVHAFRYGDLRAFRALLATHGDRIAAVVVEPAAGIEGIEGPVREADPKFLRSIANDCRQAGALLVFDEIFTGLRHRGGSVQQDTGVVPDLTCLGKALASGWPLAALVGRRDVFRAGMPNIAYDPTFKGEPHAFAAAVETLRILNDENVTDRVWQLGTHWIATLARVCTEIGVPARPTGLPIRSVLAFDGPRPVAARRRTLFQQQLVRHGALTFRGFMIPSLAHDEGLEAAEAACRAALVDLRRAIDDDDLERLLEIPLLT